MVGEAGTGKSTFSAALISEMADSSDTAMAYHFIKMSDERRLDAVRIVKSFAAQLANRCALDEGPAVARVICGGEQGRYYWVIGTAL